MTKENVIKIIRHVFHYYDEQHTDYNWSEFNEACGIVIDLLENNKIEEELEKIKHEIGKEFVDLQDGSEEWRSYVNEAVLSCYEIIEKHISELKGE